MHTDTERMLEILSVSRPSCVPIYFASHPRKSNQIIEWSVPSGICRRAQRISIMMQMPTFSKNNVWFLEYLQWIQRQSEWVTYSGFSISFVPNFKNNDNIRNMNWVESVRFPLNWLLFCTCLTLIMQALIRAKQFSPVFPFTSLSHSSKKTIILYCIYNIHIHYLFTEHFIESIGLHPTLKINFQCYITLQLDR